MLNIRFMCMVQMTFESAVIDKWPPATLAFEVDPHFLMFNEDVIGLDVRFTKLAERHGESFGYDLLDENE